MSAATLDQQLLGAAVASFERYLRVRGRTLELTSTIVPEDAVVQSMPDASPTKWHLAHTTWFFEQFVLTTQSGYQPVHPDWSLLFNSYYQSVGSIHPRDARGMITRPTWREVLDYRACVDERMQRLFVGDVLDEALATRIELGLQHEQQHQELILTDLKHLLSLNPLQPAFDPDLVPPPRRVGTELRYQPGPGGVIEIGQRAGDRFAFDNEQPRHKVWLQPHALAQRPISNAEYRDFITDGGYRTPLLWLAEGWACVQEHAWRHPMYWDPDLQSEFTLGGVREIDDAAPVAHLSYYEADAFARWAGARLPTEAEWESAVESLDPESGNFQDDGWLQPVAPAAGEGLRQCFGDVWEWTASAYSPYPGFRIREGALGEYNGKFMCGQWVLRGGSCLTPRGHVRATYRNFFHPSDRWQCMGLRLARDA